MHIGVLVLLHMYIKTIFSSNLAIHSGKVFSSMLAFYTIIQQDIDSHERTDEGIQQFADGVLEGAIHNVTMSLRRLFKLNTPAEIVRYYKRIDTQVNRRAIYTDPRMYKYTYGWNKIAHLGIRHKYLSILINSCLLIAYQLYVKLKK